MNRALKRPLSGWPVTGPITDDDKALLRYVIEVHYHPDPECFASEAEMRKFKETMLKRAEIDDFVPPLSSMLAASLPDVTRETILADVERERERLKAASYKKLTFRQHIAISLGFRKNPTVVPVN